jgi:SAM-dependent methyltransferase
MKKICRICGTNLNKRIFHIADMPLTDDFIDIKNQKKSEYIHDINIYSCDNCNVVQNPEDFDHETYYHDYQYSTGHSEFTKNFMNAYAAIAFTAFQENNHRTAESVLEVGSGDGQQLVCFKYLGVKTLLGVEPSEYLANIAETLGVKTEIDLFGTSMISRISSPVDICLSSYTFDHVRQPIDYLKAAHTLMVDGGILALEIHNFGKIVERTEYCLFEHEHTIYLNENNLSKLLEQTGFSVLSINPLPEDLTRGNSLIAIAKKEGIPKNNFHESGLNDEYIYNNLQDRIRSTIERIDNWIRDLPVATQLVGFGAGGRGIMTIAALSESKKIIALLDTNYKSQKYLTPKTRIPIVGPEDWEDYKDAHCIVFSFGYYGEIFENLIKSGFRKERIISLLNFYPNKQH